MNNLKKTAIGLCLLSCVGCSSINIEDLPSEAFATEAEVVNYNQQQLNYKASIDQLGTELEYGYALNAVSDDMQKMLIEKAKIIESELGALVYNKANSHISEELFNTFKGLIDDKIFTSDSVIQVGSSKGYYFVDKKYKLVPIKTSGEVKTSAVRYLGVNGAYKADANGNVDLDTQYVSSFESELAKSSRKTDILINDASVLTSKSEQGMMSLTGDPLKNKELALGKTRRPAFDSSLANQVIGSSATSLALMPELTRLYVPAAQSGSILSGNGIYIQGDKALTQYNYDLNKQNGTAYVRYVFKQHITEPDKIEFINAYMMNFTMNETPDIDEDLVVPDFVSEEAQKLLSRADRVIANVDLSGLMNGKVFADVGQAILTGYLSKYAYMDDHTTKLTGVVGRNMEHNSYLLRISTTRDIGAKGGVDVGRYRYDGYAVMSQIGTDFVLTDYLYTQMQTVREPSVNLDDTIIRQLASLNLAGEVDETTQESIEVMLGDMYRSVTGDDKTQKRYVYTNDGVVGYADCFTDDTALLSARDKDYAISRMKGWVNKYGSTATIYTGFVTDWMGGNESQAEFITQEVLEYPNKDAGIYLKVYYLVSNYDDTFKIDEMQTLTSKQVTGAELAEIKKKIEAKEEFIVDSPDNIDISLITESGTQNIAAKKVQQAQNAQANADSKSEAPDTSDMDMPDEPADTSDTGDTDAVDEQDNIQTDSPTDQKSAQ